MDGGVSICPDDREADLLTERRQAIFVGLDTTRAFFDQEADAEEVLHGLSKIKRVQSVFQQIWTASRSDTVLSQHGFASF